MVSKPGVTRDQVVAAARLYLATPWRHQGRSCGVDAGVDCGGLVICVARDLGLADVDVAAYGVLPHADDLRALCDQHMREVTLGDARPGDVALIRFDSEPQHLAIIGDYSPAPGQLTLIHAYRTSGCVVEHRLADVWRARITGVYSLPGVADEVAQ